MNYFKEWCEKILPIVQAAAIGEVVQASCDNKHTWFDLSECEVSDPALSLDIDDYDYRIKPSTIKIGDFDVPEPIRKAPKLYDTVYTPMIVGHGVLFRSWTWGGSEQCKKTLECGIMHKDCDSAIAHAKALIALTSAK